MSALTTEKLSRTERWSYHQFTLKAGQIAFKGGMCLLNTADGKVYEGPSLTTGLFLGIFAESVDASSAGPLGSVDQPVNVDLLKERTILWRSNDGSIAASDVGNTCYVVDDQTVSKTSTGRAPAGTIMAVSATYGVGFEVEGL